MKISKDTCRLALVQAEPALFDKAACVEKALDYIGRSAAQGAELIVFPELFIPGYPIGMNFGFVSFVCNFADVWLMVGLVLAIIDLLFLSEWAVFPLTKKARAAQAERRRQEERDKLGADPDGFDLPADPSDLAGYHVGPHCGEEDVNDGEPGKHDEDSVSESEDGTAEDKNE